MKVIGRVGKINKIIGRRVLGLVQLRIKVNFSRSVYLGKNKMW